MELSFRGEFDGEIEQEVYFDGIYTLREKIVKYLPTRSDFPSKLKNRY